MLLPLPPPSLLLPSFSIASMLLLTYCVACPPRPLFPHTHPVCHQRGSSFPSRASNNSTIHSSRSTAPPPLLLVDPLCAPPLPPPRVLTSTAPFIPLSRSLRFPSLLSPFLPQLILPLAEKTTRILLTTHRRLPSAGTIIAYDTEATHS